MKSVKTILYWVISFTWGCLMTIFGCFVALALLITGHKPHIFHYSVYFVVGNNWGGFEAGCFFVVDNSQYHSTKRHEHGHGIQNLMLGPLMPFLVSIPSAFRYWFREVGTTLKRRIVYTVLTTLITSLIGAIFIVCGIVFNIVWLWAVGIAWAIYFIAVCGIWQACEIPKYSKTPAPLYSDFWPEGWADKLGAKYFLNVKI